MVGPGEGLPNSGLSERALFAFLVTARKRPGHGGGVPFRVPLTQRTNTESGN